MKRNITWAAAAAVCIFALSIGQAQAPEKNPTSAPALGPEVPDLKNLTTLLKTDFASGIDADIGRQGARPESLAIVEDPAESGSGKVIKATMSQSEDFAHVANGVPRVELAFGRNIRLAPGRDYWIRWSIYLPKDYILDMQQPEIITQIHHGGRTGSPPFDLSLREGRYLVNLRSGKPAKKDEEHHDLGDASADRGKWVHWVLHYRPDSTGAASITELYKEGHQILSRNGTPNAYPDDNKAYLKIGIYKWAWKKSPSDAKERTAYYGDVTILGTPEKDAIKS